MNKYKYILKIGSLAAVFTTMPLVASAASCYNAFQAGGKLGDLFNYITCVIGTTVIPLIFALAIMLFVWGVVQFVINDSEEAKTQGRQFMIWGIIGLTVMVGVWGLVSVIGNTFGLNTRVIPSVAPNGQNNTSGTSGTSTTRPPAFVPECGEEHGLGPCPY